MGLTEAQLNPQQAEALATIRKRVEAGEPVSKLFGYAGTGKTSIAKLLSETTDGNVMFGAFTGKAASVLTSKGCGARTIHSRIYLPVGDRRPQMEALEKELMGLGPDADEDHVLWLQDSIEKIRETLGKPGFQLNPASDLSMADLFIVDEVSMVDEKLAQDIMYFEVPIIVLGDPAQLPPVGNAGYFTKGGEKSADYLLTQVERQAEGGQIIDLATKIRNYKGLPDSDPQVVRAASRSLALSVDQILVGKNATRWAKNKSYRKLQGRTDIVEVGERIICLENHREYQAMNGQQFIVTRVSECEKEGMINATIRCECVPPESSDRDPWDNRCEKCGWSEKPIRLWLGGFLSEKDEAELKNGMAYGKRQAAMYATYGYAITVHKAQGSEWGSVLVYDESSVFRKDGWRWLYTAVTRASQELVVVS